MVSLTATHAHADRRRSIRHTGQDLAGGPEDIDAELGQALVHLRPVDLGDGLKGSQSGLVLGVHDPMTTR